MSQPSQFLRLEQVRTAFDAGGLSGARIIAAGRRFYVTLDTRAGTVAILVRHVDQTPRNVGDAGIALRLLHDIGFQGATVEMSAWEPGQKTID